MVLFLGWLLAWLLVLVSCSAFCLNSGFTSCKGIRILEADWGRVFPRRRRRHLPIRVGLAEAQAWGGQAQFKPSSNRLKPAQAQTKPNPSRLKPRPIQKIPRKPGQAQLKPSPANPPQAGI